MATRQIAVSDSFSRERIGTPKAHMNDAFRIALEFVSVAMGVSGVVFFVNAISGGGLSRFCGYVATALTGAS